MEQPLLEQPFEASGVRGILHVPETPNGDALALTHGAGSNCTAPLLVALARTFCELGMTVLRYDLPFRVLRPKGSPFPSGQARDREGVGAAITEVRKLASRHVFAGGVSYGGRMTAMLASERPKLANGLLLLSYPLHPPGKPEQLRTAFFPQWRTPALFVHGSRDPFGKIEELRAAIAAIPARTDIMEVPSAGHDLKQAMRLGGDILSRMLF